MRAAGAYSWRVEWLKKTKVSTDAYGQPEWGYPGRGYLWAAVEDVNSNRETRLESERQVTTATVSVRGCVGVVAGDRLRISGQDWDVKHVRDGDNETICEVER